MTSANSFDDIDKELLDIFLYEAHDLMEGCDGMLIRLREHPDKMEEIVGLQRALHTIKGGARMTGLICAGDLSHSIESFLGAVVARKIVLDEPRLNLLGDAMDELRHMVELAGRGIMPERPTLLIDALEDQAGSGKQSAQPTRSKVVEKQESHDGQPLESLGSISSGDNSGGKGRLGELGEQHAGEMAGFAGELDFKVAKSQDSQDSGLNALDQERKAIEELLEEELRLTGQAFESSEQDMVALSGNLEKRQRPDPERSDKTQGQEEQVPTPKGFTPAPMPDLLAEQRPGKKNIHSNEQVRIQAELLDLLINRSNEMAIYRSRLEQQLGALRAVVSELGRTNMRMRDQLRRLDVETEAQIVARYQREKTSLDQSFDPLELDRFSSLQQLTRALAESSDDFNGLHDTLESLSRQYDQLVQQQGKVSSELQEGLLRARLLPFDKLAPRLARIVRQAASDVGKRVRLDLDQAHGELDRNVLDRIASPLEHMIRNSIAHGIEKPDVRIARGKPPEGTIGIQMRNDGAEIVIEVADDGAGLDREAIRRRALERGLIKDNDELRDRALDELIFAPGFSTTEKVDQLSGRGVGMDVVRSEVRQLGGSVEVSSIAGQGAKFTLRIPQKMAVTQAVHVRAEDSIFAIPSSSILGIGKTEGQQNVYNYDGTSYPIISLRTLAGIRQQEKSSRGDEDHNALLLVRSGDLNVAVKVDQVLQSQEIVVKQVGAHIAEVPGIYGATIDQSGRVVVILDLASMVRQFMAKPRKPEVAQTVQARAPLVMVVDDSITMRKVTSRVLERHKFEVKTARDGMDALGLLEDCVPDLMLLDIEMPRMDGYELTGRMRSDPRYKDIPIIMITSRTGDKHRQKAMHLGVQGYLGKPYQEAELLRNIHEILGLPTHEDMTENTGEGHER